jgi:hypothetical protein
MAAGRPAEFGTSAHWAALQLFLFHIRRSFNRRNGLHLAIKKQKGGSCGVRLFGKRPLPLMALAFSTMIHPT